MVKYFLSIFIFVRMFKPLLTLLPLTTVVIIALTVDSSTSVIAQYTSNVSNLTGIENTTTSATVTAKQNVSPPELEPGIHGIEVNNMTATVDDNTGKITQYRANVKVSFGLER